jgi:hypothetical protein
MGIKRAQHENEEWQKRQPNIENRCGLCRGHRRRPCFHFWKKSNEIIKSRRARRYKHFNRLEERKLPIFLKRSTVLTIKIKTVLFSVNPRYSSCTLSKLYKVNLTFSRQKQCTSVSYYSLVSFYSICKQSEEPLFCLTITANMKYISFFVHIWHF